MVVRFNQGELMTTYLIDPTHSSAEFNIKHMMIAKVSGGFEKVNGSFTYDPKNPEASKVEAIIDAASIYTREAQRDAHLKSADFFDVENYPTLTFSSTKVIANKGEMKIEGDLTIRGVTNSVTLNVEAPSDEIKDPWGNIKIAVSGSTKIKRKDFGLTWNSALEAGGFLVGDDVNISLEIQFVKQV
jgi:polyisoprenoid-binding protein YceI